MAVDSNNDVIVAGFSMRDLSPRVYITIKYSCTGLPIWTNCYREGQDSATQVAVDGSNDVIVTGYSAIGGLWGYATIKYSSLGVPLWTNRYDGLPNLSYPNSIATDSNKNVIVTGAAARDGGYTDYATIKYSPNGVPLWTNRYNPQTNSDSRAAGDAVAVDSRNDVIVAGRSDLYCATIKYSSTGVPLWTNLYGPRSSNHNVCGMALDHCNNIIVTGAGADSAGFSDYLTIKCSSAGIPLWTNCYNGPLNGDDYARPVAVDRADNVIVTGLSTNSAGGYDYTTIKYSGTGVALWTNCYKGPANELAWFTSLALDRSGNVIVSGHSAAFGGIYSYATIEYVCVPEPVLTGLQLTNSTFQLRVDEVLQPGTLVIEACTSPSGWAPVFTNTTPTNVLFYTDPDAGHLSTRFYRACQFP